MQGNPAQKGVIPRAFEVSNKFNIISSEKNLCLFFKIFIQFILSTFLKQ
jgi:hypothetical protein